MFKLYLTSILVAEIVALAALEFMSRGEYLLYLVPIIPQAIAGYRARDPATNSPDELSRAIVERAEEIQHALEESPSDEVRVEMCALGYRACANDMITLTHLTNEALPDASFLKRIRLRRSRKKAIDALSEARRALPPGALRTAPQERQ